MLKWLTRACFDFTGFCIQRMNTSSAIATELDAAITYIFYPSFPFSCSFSVVSLCSNRLSYSEAYCIPKFTTGTCFLCSRTESTVEILFVYFTKP